MQERRAEAYYIEKSERWQINVQQEGVRRSFYSTKPGKRGKIEAERKADKWLETGSTRENVRLRALWQEFLDFTKENHSTSTYKQHEYIGRLRLLPYLEHKKVCEITELDWQQCILNAGKTGKAFKTLSNIRGTITSFCRYARRNRIPIEYPHDLQIPNDAEEGEIKILQPQDFVKLFTIDYIIRYRKPCPSFYINAFRFIIVSGMRRGELCGLQHKDIVNGIIHINRSVNDHGEITKGKNKRARRRIKIGKHMQELLEAQSLTLRNAGIVSPWVFPDENGQMLQGTKLYKRWYVYRNQHGLEASLHELRHTYASYVKSDMPLELIKLVMGHDASTNTLGIYGHEVDGELDRATDISDKVFDTVFKQNVL